MNRSKPVQLKRKRDYTKLKLTVIVSLVWIGIAAVLVGSYVYGQMQFNKGVNYGIEQTKAIIAK